MELKDLERAAYLSGDTNTAELLARIEDLERERDELQDKLDDMPSEDELNQNARDLENLKEFFYDCFGRLAGNYPRPEWSSDYDKNVIFEAIERGERVTA